MTHLSTHWPYIAASYGLCITCALTLTFSATLRLRRARTRLTQLEQHIRQKQGEATP